MQEPEEHNEDLIAECEVAGRGKVSLKRQYPGGRYHVTYGPDLVSTPSLPRAMAAFNELVSCAVESYSAKGVG